MRYSYDPFNVTLGRLIDASGKSLRRFGSECDLSAGYLCHLISGNRATPENHVLERIADALGVPADTFREYRARIAATYLEQHPDADSTLDRLYRRALRTHPTAVVS